MTKERSAAVAGGRDGGAKRPDVDERSAAVAGGRDGGAKRPEVDERSAAVAGGRDGGAKRPEVDERAALARLRTTGDAIVDGVEACVPGWVVNQVRRVLDAWGGADEEARMRAEDDAVTAGRAASRRVAAELRTLLALDPAEQSATPLEVVRTAIREPTRVLEAAGVPPVVRDAFDERSLPDDRYGLAPRTLGDLGDEALAPLHLAWGMAKAAVLRARSEA